MTRDTAAIKIAIAEEYIYLYILYLNGIIVLKAKLAE